MTYIYATYQYTTSAGHTCKFHASFPVGAAVPARYRDPSTGKLGTLQYWQAANIGAYEATCVATRMQSLRTWDAEIASCGYDDVIALWREHAMVECPTDAILRYVATHDSDYQQAHTIYKRCRQLLARAAATDAVSRG